MPSEPNIVLLDTSRTWDVQAHRERLTSRIQVLKEEIRTLEKACNALAAPNRIPPEVLCRIFFMVQRRSRARGLWKPGNLAWINVTHVCRHWRETALDCTALWTTLSFINPAFTQAMIQRSKNAPLTIDPTPVMSEVAKFQDVLAQALSRSERVRSVTLLSMAQVSPLDFTAILSRFSGPAPMLEDLYLAGDSGVDLPLRFLEDGAPRLKSLHLSNCRIRNWDSLPLGTSLTSLRLNSDTETNACRPTWNAFLLTLHGMTSLERLSLARFLPAEPGVPTSSVDLVLPFSLPTIRSLDLSDVELAVEKFFSAILVPNARDVVVKLSSIQHTSFPRRVLVRLATSWSGQTQKAMQRFKMCQFPDREASLWFTFRGKPNRSLRLHFPPSSLSMDNVLDVVSSEMDMSRLVVLELQGDASLTSEAFSRVFGGLKRLCYLYCSDNGLTEPLLDSLTYRQGGEEEPFVDANGSGQSPTVAFPALEDLDLEFEDMKFADGRSSVPKLIKALRSRPKSCPKLTLNLHECLNIDEALSDRLTRKLRRVEVVYHAIDDWIPFSDSDADSEPEYEGEGGGESEGESERDSNGERSGEAVPEEEEEEEGEE